MADPKAPEGNDPEPKEPEGGAPPEGDDGSKIDNATVKSSPLFQKVTSELSQLRQEKADREAKEAEDKVAAERKSLEAEGKYEEALKLRDDQLKEQADKHTAELLQRDLKIELSTAGFTNQTFVNGAISIYDGDSEGVANYVKDLATKEENKIFIGKAQRQTLPEAKPGSGSAVTMSYDEAFKLSKDQTQDPEVRAKARKVLAADFDAKHRL